MCDLCPGGGGVEQLLEGHRVVMCAGCASSPLARRRLLERVSGKPMPCDCGGDCKANQRAREAL